MAGISASAVLVHHDNWLLNTLAWRKPRVDPAARIETS
jgi:hypothetical protein